MKCPNCNNDIAYSKSWKITKWTSIECSQCQTLLNRKFDLKYILIALLFIISHIGLLLIAIYILLNWGTTLTIILGIPLVIFWVLFVLYLDRKSMRLAPVEKRQGIKTIMGHKYKK